MNPETAERGTILRGLVGSTVHGLNANDGIEDRDEMGICLEPLEDAMALWDPFEQFIYRVKRRLYCPSGPGARCSKPMLLFLPQLRYHLLPQIERRCSHGSRRAHPLTCQGLRSASF